VRSAPLVWEGMHAAPQMARLGPPERGVFERRGVSRLAEKGGGGKGGQVRRLGVGQERRLQVEGGGTAVGMGRRFARRGSQTAA
jgi:hypothetical protein